MVPRILYLRPKAYKRLIRLDCDGSPISSQVFSKKWGPVYSSLYSFDAIADTKGMRSPAGDGAGPENACREIMRKSEKGGLVNHGDSGLICATSQVIIQ
jgi:hypothetical protein